ncbi:MAG: NAD(+)/NADH kinase [bacterium]
MKNIGIFCKPDRQRAPKILEELLAWIRAKDLIPYLECTTAELIAFQSSDHVLSLQDLTAVIDLLIIMGGDGTLLRAAHVIEGRNIPILGVNLGSLGFLTEITIPELLPTLDAILERGYYKLDERMMLAAFFSSGDQGAVQRSCALNDVVFSKGIHDSQLIELSIKVDGIWINKFLADGLILSTSTGSTAYSLSAGGPILHPSMQAILITPICPHMLTNRPIVVPGNQVIEVTAKKGILVAVDGEFVKELSCDEQVRVRQGEHKLSLIQAPDKDYYQVLRTKLKWGER